MYNVLHKKNNISSTFAKIITSKFPKVSYEWLLTGEGEMLKGRNKNMSVIEKAPFSIPLIPFDTIAGFNEFDNEGITYENCERYAVPEFERNGVEFVIRVSGSSMYTKYSNGDILACKKSQIYSFSNGEKCM